MSTEAQGILGREMTSLRSKPLPAPSLAASSSAKTELEAPTSLLVDCRSAGPDLFPFYRGLVAQLAKRPSRYAKLVFSSTDRATDEFIVRLRTTLPTTLQPRVVSLRADGVPTHELGQMGFRQNALPAYVRADYGRLLESEDSL